MGEAGLAVQSVSEIELISILALGNADVGAREQCGCNNCITLISKFIFQRERCTNFLLTNYSFGKVVRTSTLCMTQVIFPTIVYRQIISLIIHCITIPVGQKFIYTDCAFKQLGRFLKMMTWL